MRAKIVSERALILPESTADHCEMYVVLPWLPTPEEVTTTDALLAAKEVTSGLERGDGNPTLLLGAMPGKDVEDGFGGESIYGRTPGVLENE